MITLPLMRRGKGGAGPASGPAVGSRGPEGAMVEDGEDGGGIERNVGIWMVNWAGDDEAVGMRAGDYYVRVSSDIGQGRGRG